MLVAILNDLASESLQHQIWDQCMSENWAFGHGSNTGDATASFWKMNLEGNDACDRLWDLARPKCEQLIGKPLKVLRQYANGHTYGLGGQAHTDDKREGCYTLLYYANPQWEQVWHGETIYYDEKGEIKAAIKPAPNRGVFFDARIPHAGRAPSRYFGGLRVTVAYKLQVANSTSEPP